MYEEKIANLQHEFKVMHEQLTSEIKLLSKYLTEKVFIFTMEKEQGRAYYWKPETFITVTFSGVKTELK